MGLEEVFDEIKPKKNTKLITILIIIAIIILIGLVLTYIFVVKDGSSSKSKDFIAVLDNNYLNYSSFGDEKIQILEKSIKEQSFVAERSYYANANMSQNMSSLQALNDSKITFEQTKDNSNNKEQINFEQQIGDQTIKYELNYSGQRFNLKINGVDDQYISLENTNLETFLGYLGVQNSQLYPSSYENNITSTQLSSILYEELKHTLNSVSSKNYYDVEENGSTGIAIVISQEDFNNLVSKYIDNLFSNSSFKTYWKTKNTSITDDELTNICTYLKTKLSSVFDKTGENVNIIAFNEGTRVNQLEIRYGSTQKYSFSFTSSSISIGINNKSIEITKKVDVNNTKIEYDIVGNLFDYGITSNYTYEQTSAGKYNSNFYISIEKDSNTAVYQLTKTYQFYDNVSVSKIQDDEIENISEYNQNEFDKFESDFNAKLNNFLIEKLSAAGYSDQYNPLYLSIPGILVKDGLANSDLAKYMLSYTEGVVLTASEDEPEQEENQQEEETVSEEEIIARNEDYKNYTYEPQKYESIYYLTNKICLNNEKYRGNDDLTIDVYSYYPENAQKGEGNYIRAGDVSTLFNLDEDKNYTVYIDFDENKINYITIIEVN